MNWLLPLFLIGLSSCGDDPSLRSPIIDGDPELIAYVTQFVSDARSIGREAPLQDIQIVFGQPATPESPNRIGSCYVGAYRLILIDETWFRKASSDDKTALMYHEFGHCFLNRGHNDTCLEFNGNNCVEPYSLMSSVLVSGSYGSNKSWYLQELFGSK